MVKPHSSNFRVITTNFLGVRKLRVITVILLNLQLQEELDQGIGLSHGGVTLRRLLVWTFDPLLRLKTLAALVDVCKGSVLKRVEIYFTEDKFILWFNMEVKPEACKKKMRGKCF